MILSEQTTEQILTQADKKLRGGPKRMTWCLHRNGPTHTGELANACALANLSDVAHRANRQLIPLGLKIVCNLPKRRIKNRFGDVSQSHIWRLTQLRG